MKTFFKIFLSLTLVAGSYNSLFSSPNKALDIYHQANIAYQKLDYEKSIALYEQLLKSNTVSEEIFYNLGNAYFKTGNTPKAILNYERALKINPEDEDVAFNLKIASLKVVDKIESVPDIFYMRWVNHFATIVSADTWAILLIVLIWLLFVTLTFYVMGRTVASKKLWFVLLLAFISLTFVTGVLAARSHSISSVDIKAIIMASSVYVKSSPDEKGNDLFILHEGTKVEVLDELNDWKKIRIANGSVGWMKVGEMEII